MSTVHRGRRPFFSPRGLRLITPISAARLNGRRGRWRRSNLPRDLDSLKSALFKSLDVIGGKREPLAALPFIREPPVPILLDPLRVIGLDDVNRVRLLW